MGSKITDLKTAQGNLREVTQFYNQYHCADGKPGFTREELVNQMRRASKTVRELYATPLGDPIGFLDSHTYVIKTWVVLKSILESPNSPIHFNRLSLPAPFLSADYYGGNPPYSSLASLDFASLTGISPDTIGALSNFIRSGFEAKGIHVPQGEIKLEMSSQNPRTKFYNYRITFPVGNCPAS